MEKKEYNETVTSCIKPLQRVCPTEDGGEVVERIRRDTSNLLERMAEELDDTPPSSTEDFLPAEGTQCSTYYETICEGESSLSSLLSEECSRVPVRLCADQCHVKEGPLNCKTLHVKTLKEEPQEKCELIPQKTCR